MGAPYFVPAADLLPYWPHDLLATSDVGMLGRLSQSVGVTEFELIEYEGELGEFVPFLRAAEWTGVGRQTSWGKGAITVIA